MEEKGFVVPDQPNIDWAYRVPNTEEITLAEIFEDLRKELDKKEIAKPPLSFTTRQFQEEMDCGKHKAARILKELESEGKVRRLKRIPMINAVGGLHVVSGWQWIKD